MAPACPRSVPEAREEKGFGHRSSVNEIGRGGVDYYVFSVEWGAPYGDRVNERDRPPRFSHVVVHAGDLARAAFGFGWPGERKTPKGQPRAKLRGERTWGERTGELVLAPPYPHGGIDGAHLIFRWEEEAREYAVSLHAWLPLDEAESALERTVLSIP